MHRFYINPDDIEGNKATIVGQDAKHLVNVLRLVSGNIVELVDGVGTHYLSEIDFATSKKVVLKIIEKSFLKAESPAHITIAQGVLKDNKMDVILRHLTELGIKEWIPFFASRSVPSPNPNKMKNDLIIPESKFSNKTKGQKINNNIEISNVNPKIKDVRVERWERIARESIKQCGRSVMPIIHKPISYDEMLIQSDTYCEKIVFWENATTPIDLIRERQERVRENRIIVMIGPEGGFSEQEVNIAKEHGFKAFSLGSRILRAETASIVASTLIQNIFGDLGKNNRVVP
ncbi:MAG: 16S rRNA (uracil(1498)-N(3))-methyltransferase [Desulfamplus sp.]|nr:16S rRNA (uracil(1498)-N(3))-methyltransferase [Desulfamplus sp.]